MSFVVGRWCLFNRLGKSPGEGVPASGASGVVAQNVAGHSEEPHPRGFRCRGCPVGGFPGCDDRFVYEIGGIVSNLDTVEEVAEEAGPGIPHDLFELRVHWLAESTESVVHLTSPAEEMLPSCSATVIPLYTVVIRAL